MPSTTQSDVPSRAILRRHVDIPRQPCNKLIWVVVTSSTVAICFASWDRSQSHTIAILGRDCSPPSPVPAHKLASKQASKQANMLSIWFSTLLSFGPHLWFCLSQWCHVLRDCGTILQGASKHITTMPWRVIQYQHCERALIWTYRILHRTSECQAGLYIDHKGVDSMCSCKLACSIKNISKSQTPAKYPVEVKRVLVKGHALLTQMCHSRWLRAPHWIDYVAFRCLRIPL